jgi:hypothetical protein
MAPRINANHAVAFLALVLAVCVFAVMEKLGAPSKICWGSGILSILVVAIFWTAVNLGTDDEDDET